VGTPRGPRLRAFTAALVAGRAGAARETEAPPPAAGTGAIRLMTIHAAKGLEFPVVCVADLAHTSNTTESPLLTDGRRVGLRLVTAERERIDVLAYDELRAERRAAAAAEEERIVYVAMTRARERLISAAPRDSRTGRGMPPPRSAGWARRSSRTCRSVWRAANRASTASRERAGSRSA